MSFINNFRRKDSRAGSITRLQYQKVIEAQQQEYLNALEEQKLRDAADGKERVSDTMKVVSYLRVISDGKMHIAYTVAIYEHDTEPRTVLKTYSQLLALHKKVMDSYPVHKKTLPKFPPKKITGNTKDDFLIKRMEQLDVYLQTVSGISGIFQNQWMKEFSNLATPTINPIQRKPLTEEELIRRRTSFVFEAKKRSSEKGEGKLVSDGSTELQEKLSKLDALEIELKKKEEELEKEEKEESFIVQQLEEKERNLKKLQDESDEEEIKNIMDQDIKNSRSYGEIKDIKVEEVRDDISPEETKLLVNQILQVVDDEEKRMKEEEEIRREEDAERKWIEAEKKRKEDEEAKINKKKILDDIEKEKADEEERKNLEREFLERKQKREQEQKQGLAKSPETKKTDLVVKSPIKYGSAAKESPPKITTPVKAVVANLNTKQTTITQHNKPTTTALPETKQVVSPKTPIISKIETPTKSVSPVVQKTTTQPATQNQPIKQNPLPSTKAVQSPAAPAKTASIERGPMKKTSSTDKLLAISLVQQRKREQEEREQERKKMEEEKKKIVERKQIMEASRQKIAEEKKKIEQEKKKIEQERLEAEKQKKAFVDAQAELEQEAREIQESIKKAREEAQARKNRDLIEEDLILQREEEWKKKKSEKNPVKKVIKWDMPAGLELQGLEDEDEDEDEIDDEFCVVCGETEAIGELIICHGEECGRWFHFPCSGVSPKDYDETWICLACSS